MNSLRACLLFGLVTPACLSFAQSWNEQFSHNNPALYTNLNGGPANLSITGGIASFGGSLGTYYGRADLLPDTIAVVMTAQLTPALNGVLGIGWYHPTFGSVSAAYDADAELLMIVTHDSFGFNVEGSVSTQGIIADKLILNSNHTAYLDGQGGFVQVSWQPSQQLDLSSHFLLYGAEGPGGPSEVDWVFAASLPEPSALAVLLVGIGALALRTRRSR